jgi:hypothetical protein
MLGVNVYSRLAAASGGLVLGVLNQSAYNREESKDETAGCESKKVRPIAVCVISGKAAVYSQSG